MPMLRPACSLAAGLVFPVVVLQSCGVTRTRVARTAGAQSQESRLTAARPVAVSLRPLHPTVAPGGHGYLLLRILVPEGLWIGAAEGAVRSPGPTTLELGQDPFIEFGEPRWPEPRVAGIPVNLGTTRVHSGRIKVVTPFYVSATCPEGKRKIALRLTYTPGLNAGHLSPHLDEPYEAEIEVRRPVRDAEHVPSETSPEMEAAPGVRVERVEPRLPQPLGSMLFQIPEDSFLAGALHSVWEDEENHDKTVQALAIPWVFGSKNNGTSLGAGLFFLNTTREGVGTSAVNLRAIDNEYVGPAAAIDVVSCPGAFHNYWFQAFHGEDNYQGGRLHVENLAFVDDSFGYELQLDAFEDGRYRFFGLGPRTKEGNETAYTNQEFGGWLDLYWNFSSNWRAAVGGRGRRVNVRDPARRLLKEQPSTRAVFPQATGARGATVVGERVSLVFDRRNQEFTPSRGTFARLRAELNHIVDDEGDNLAERWGRYEVLIRQYFSTPGERFTLVLSNVWVLTSKRRGIPFFEQSTLGGADSLRAFDSGRFTGQKSVLASVELRVQALHMVAMGMPLDVELAPFLDAGQVFEDSVLRGRFNLNPGLSMRALNRPNIGLVLNFAYGQDGVLFTGGVSLPF